MGEDFATRACSRIYRFLSFWGVLTPLKIIFLFAIPPPLVPPSYLKGLSRERAPRHGPSIDNPLSETLSESASSMALVSTTAYVAGASLVGTGVGNDVGDVSATVPATTLGTLPSFGNDVGVSEGGFGQRSVPILPWMCSDFGLAR